MPCVGGFKNLQVNNQPFGTIDADLFHPLVGLLVLEIKNNHLTTLPILTPLRRLTRLFAEDNNITVITAQHFQGLNSLKLIGLNY